MAGSSGLDDNTMPPAPHTGPRERLLRAPRLSWVVAAALAGLFALTASGVLAGNTDPRDENPLLTNGIAGSRYAWSENAGWLNARPAGEAYGPRGSAMEVSDTGATGWLWGENIGWVNLSCQNDATCGGSAGDWGVANDGTGNLSGYAWAENAGWINFSCSTNSTCGSVSYGVTIDPETGQFHGEAWAENLGWIKFNCSDDASCGTAQFALQTGWPDSDADGCRDSKEAAYPLDEFDPWDFYTVPIPALINSPSPQTDFKDHVIVASDAQAVFVYFQAGAKVGRIAYDQDLNLNGIADGIEYDRTVVGPGESGLPDGKILASDAQLAFAQFKAGRHC